MITAPETTRRFHFVAALLVASTTFVTGLVSTPLSAAEASKPWPTDTGNSWTDREIAVWNELAARYGAAEVSIARNMFPRASVDVSVYRDVVYWLQDQQDAQSDMATNLVKLPDPSRRPEPLLTVRCPPEAVQRPNSI